MTEVEKLVNRFFVDASAEMADHDDKATIYFESISTP